MINSFERSNTAYNGEVYSLNKGSEKDKIIGGCLIALGIIIVGLAIAMFFIAPCLGLAIVAVLLGALAAAYPIFYGCYYIISAQEEDKRIDECKQKHQESTTLEKTDGNDKTKKETTIVSELDSRKQSPEDGSITSEEEYATSQTRRQKADLSNVDLGKLPGEEESITLEPQEVGESQIKRRQFSSNVD